MHVQLKRKTWYASIFRSICHFTRLRIFCQGSSGILVEIWRWRWLELGPRDILLKSSEILTISLYGRTLEIVQVQFQITAIKQVLQ